MKQTKKEKWILFAKDVSIQEVVPESNSLCPPYMDNIFATCMSTLPMIDKLVSGIRVLKGFIPRAKMFAMKTDRHLDKYEYAHSEGNAIVVTWDSYDEDSAYDIARQIFFKLKDNNLHIILWEGSMGLYRELDSRKILKKIHGIDKPKTMLSD